MSQCLIVVLGMHRSGTSVVTRLVNLLGAELGKPLLEPKPGINDEGFWENQQVVRINDAILAALNSTWFDHRPYPDDWWLGKDFDTEIDAIRQLCGQLFSESRLVAIKDPRLCRTLPLWRRALEPLGYKFRLLQVIRDPMEVANSLRRRDDLPLLMGCYLWLIYVQDALRYSNDLPRLIINYAAVLNDWRAVAQAAARILDIEWSPIAPEHEIDAAIRPNLRHQKRESLNLSLHDVPAVFAETLYQSLLASRDGHSVSVSDKISLIRLYRNCRDVHDALFAANRQWIDTRGRLFDLGEQHNHAIEVVKKRDIQLANLSAQLEQLGRDHRYAITVVDERDEQLSRLNAQLQQLGKQHDYAIMVIEERDAQLSQLSQRLNQIYSHWCWRLLSRIGIV